jgi:hypothetical protein
MASGSNPMDDIPDAIADHYIAMFQLAAAAMTYVTDPDRWAGFLAWVEQTPGVTIPPGKSAEMCEIMRNDARMVLGIAEAGERMRGE